MKYSTCPKCNTKKPVSEFKKHKLAKSGICWCVSCANEASRVWLVQLKLEVITALGGKCAHCAEADIDVLTVDHIDQQGSAHRLANRLASGWKTFIWLKRNSYPEGFRVLCFNCNTKAYRNWLRQQKETQ